MGAYHPQVVHFAIALVFAGVAFRLLSLTGRAAFSGPAATTLILAGTLASFLAVQSGTAAHEPVERIPGVSGAVDDHETWGKRARNAFVVVSLVELAALVLTWRRHRLARSTALAAAAVGVLGLVVMYEAAEHGGSLVYSYAGGVGMRRGDAAGVNRLFIAGAHGQARQDLQAGETDKAMALIELAAERFPANAELQLLAAEWATDVQGDPAASLRRLDALSLPQEDTRSRIRAGIARANALAAQGNVAGARAVLQTLLGEFPDSEPAKLRLEELAAVAEKPGT
jgi:uncharacterized membrane protein